MNESTKSTLTNIGFVLGAIIFTRLFGVAGLACVALGYLVYTKTVEEHGKLLAIAGATIAGAIGYASVMFIILLMLG
jgi:hypothetical protein